MVLNQETVFQKNISTNTQNNLYVIFNSPHYEGIREQLVKICGHYVLSYPNFINDIKSQFPGIDEKVKQNITKKLNELYS